jgi:hypothetical protein
MRLVSTPNSILLTLLIRVSWIRYGAGSASTQDTLLIFVLCMVLNPEVQEKARQGLDRVVGRDRLPSLSDRSKLPYIGRIFYETERYVENFQLNVWKLHADHIMTLDGILLLLFGFLTSLTKTIFIGICSSQKGTPLLLVSPVLVLYPMMTFLNNFRSIVISNVYAILHDPSVYSNPDEFNPDRYLPASEGGLGEPLPIGNFGFGRR